MTFPRTCFFRSRQAYLLQELMVGLVIFGIAMIPIVRGFMLLPRISAAASAQARAENWRSAEDQFVSAGIDPSDTGALSAVSADLDVSHLNTSTLRYNLMAQVGAPKIAVLSQHSTNVSELRAIPGGIEIFAATTLPAPRTDPLPPLPSVKLRTPTLSPASGTFLSALSLSADGSGAYTSNLQATAANSSDRVVLRQIAPSDTRAESLGETQIRMSAVDLAHSISGTAWSEFPGNAVVDTKVTLDDGRSRWLVRVGPQVQVYEPSDLANFIYGVDLGRPVYRVGGVEFASGSEVSVNFEQAIAIASGASSAIIDYPSDVQIRFGESWEQVRPRFTWTFGAFLGDSSSGNTSSIYSGSGRNLWDDHRSLEVKALSQLAGVSAWAGTWNLTRSVTELVAPERATTFYDQDTDAPGSLDFFAPIFAKTGLREGRPEVDGLESVGTTLSVPLVP